LELALHLGKQPVLHEVATLVTLIDQDMPYTASLIGLPGLILLFHFEQSAPSRAMQLLEP